MGGEGGGAGIREWKGAEGGRRVVSRDQIHAEPCSCRVRQGRRITMIEIGDTEQVLVR